MPYRRVKYKPTNVDVDKFEIDFDNKSMKFRPLQMISGNVYLELANDLILKGLYFEIKGQISIHPRGPKNTIKKNHFQQRIYRVGGYLVSNGIREKYLPRGTFEIPFGYFLPSKLPNSLSNTNSDVEYFCTFLMTSVKAKQTTKNTKKENILINKVKIPFHIIANLFLKYEATLDLSSIRTCGVAQEFSIHQNVNSWRHSLGYLDITLSLWRVGYIPGEKVLFKIHIRNGTDETLSVKVRIVREMLYKMLNKFCIGRTRIIRVLHVLAKKESEDKIIDTNLRYIWQDYLELPALSDDQNMLPSNLGWNGNIIELNYIFETEVPHPKRKTPFAIKIPLIVGTIPIKSLRPEDIAERAKEAQIVNNYDNKMKL